MPRRGSRGRTKRFGSRSAQSRSVPKASPSARYLEERKRRPSERVSRIRPIEWEEDLPQRKGTRLRRDKVQTRSAYGRDSLPARKKRAQKSGLPSAVVLVRPENARKDRRQADKKTPCAARKQIRRAVIIAKGHGGINRAKNYRRHKKCQ